mgnify:CR=1 FL=1
MRSARVKPAQALRAGDRIRLVAPASPFPRDQFRAGLEQVRRMGFDPIWDPVEHSRTGFLAGSDASRAARLQRALVEPESQAVWSIRGGYGTARLLRLLDLDACRRRAKPLIGFSDITALLVNLARPGGLVGIHGPVITQLGLLPKSNRRWLGRLLRGAAGGDRLPLGRLRMLVPGRAEGRLLGGNLAVLTSLVGTAYMPDLRGAILFIEEVGESAYRLDRLWGQLAMSGALDGVAGVVLGQLTRCEPAGRSRWSARTVLERAVASLGRPAVSGAAFGHGSRNAALPVGSRARLDADRRSLRLLDQPVE